MANSTDNPSYLSELASTRRFKRNQGRMTRQLSMVGMCLLLYFGCWRLGQGPLSDYVTSWYVVQVSYSAAEADTQLESGLEDLAEKHQATLGDRSVVGSERDLYFHFPTSSGYTTDAELKSAAASRVREFREAAATQYSGQLTIETPDHTSRRAYGISLVFPLILALAGTWMIYRLINWPRFANFLISVEAEMDKVSWASRDELRRATIVVITTMFFLGFVLFAYDLFWVWLFKLVGILHADTP